MMNDGQNKSALEQIAPAVAQAQSFTYPLMYERIGARVITLFASCFFVRIDGREYLVSAGHALRDFESSKNHLLTRNSSSIIRIPANIISTALDKKGRDHLDVAVIELTPGFSVANKINIIDASIFADSRLSTQRWQRMFTGFPASHNKNILSSRDRLHLYLHGFADVANDDEVSVNFSEFKKSPEDHVVVQLQEGISDRGAYQNVPINPKGMSGGPMWKVATQFDSREIFLEGVFIEMHNRANKYYGFATKLHHIVGFIRQLSRAQ